MTHKKKQIDTVSLAVIGWREWVSMPDWNIDYIKAKIDTGARTSSLHADRIELYQQDGINRVRFVICPWQNNEADAVEVDFPVLTIRDIRSSSGIAEKRPVILARFRLDRTEFEAELTLTNREQMGFRMLLGREAIRGRFLVNSGRSYISGRPDKDIRKMNRVRTG